MSNDDIIANNVWENQEREKKERIVVECMEYFHFLKFYPGRLLTGFKSWGQTALPLAQVWLTTRPVSSSSSIWRYHRDLTWVKILVQEEVALLAPSFFLKPHFLKLSLIFSSSSIWKCQRGLIWIRFWVLLEGGSWISPHFLRAMSTLSWQGLLLEMPVSRGRWVIPRFFWALAMLASHNSLQQQWHLVWQELFGTVICISLY